MSPAGSMGALSMTVVVARVRWRDVVTGSQGTVSISWLTREVDAAADCRRAPSPYPGVGVDVSRLRALNIAVKVRVRTTTLDRINPAARPVPRPMTAHLFAARCSPLGPPTWMPRRWGRWRLSLLWQWHKHEHSCPALAPFQSLLRRSNTSAPRPQRPSAGMPSYTLGNI